jgi:hypothetical protein
MARPKRKPKPRGRRLVKGKQFGLFDATIQERFETFHKQHPEVYGYLLALCFDLLHKGRKRYGIRPLCERVRWHFQVEQDLGDEFKLNDHYLSRYARLIVHEHPEFDGFFEVREIKTP